MAIYINPSFAVVIFYFYFHLKLQTVQAGAHLQIGDECVPEERSSQSNLITIYDDLGIPNSNTSKNMTLSVNASSVEAIASVCDPNVPLACLAGRCLCKKGYTINRNGTRCLEVARNGLESSCEENIQCWKGLLGRMSECNLAMGKCQCYESETLSIVFHRGRCSYGESLGEYCQIEGLCEATTLNATCRSGGTCQCKEGFVPSWDKSRCLPIATAGLNSTCEENIQCEKSQLGALSECNQETMTCNCYKIPDMDTVFFGGKCYFDAALGDVCQVSAQCQKKTKYAMCSRDGKCFCDDGYVPNGNNTLCLPIPIPISDGAADLPGATDGTTIHSINSNGECSEDVQCVRLMGPFSRCNVAKQKCECFIAENHHLRLYSHHHHHHPHNLHHNSNHQDNGVTSPIAPSKQSKLGVSHNESELELLDQHWNSSPNLVMVGSKCYLAKDLGQPCKFNKQCSVVTENAWCDNGRCECLDDSHVRSEDGRKCLKIGQRGLDSVCDEDAQCTKSELGPLTRCNLERKRCECSNSVMPVVYFKGKCYFHRQLGSSCESSVECQAGSNYLADCSIGRCRCQNGTIKLSPHLCGFNATVYSASESSHKVGVVDWKLLLIKGLLVARSLLLSRFA